VSKMRLGCCRRGTLASICGPAALLRCMLTWLAPLHLLLLPCALQGEEAVRRLTVPRLRVRRDWHKGLNPDHVDHRWVCSAR